MERPTQVVVIAILIALIGAVAALRLDTDAGVSTLVDRGSGTYSATKQFDQKFGSDPVVVLVKGDLGKLLLGPDLARLTGLEACLAGRDDKECRAESEGAYQRRDERARLARLRLRPVAGATH